MWIDRNGRFFQMSAAVTPSPLRLDRLEEPRNIDDVLHNIDQIIDWSINAESHIGYFAVLYRRVTLAIKEAIKEDKFSNGPRIEQLDVAFARRYFNALNAYFYPDEYQGLTLPWKVAFVGDHDDQAIIVQHMLAGLNAHITFDLGLALLAIAPNSPDPLKKDYKRVNRLLCSQIPGILKVVQQLSPELRWIRWLMPDEVGVLKRALTKLRSGAWLFAVYVSMYPQKKIEKTLHQEAWTAALSSWYLQPTERWTFFPMLIRFIAKHESDNVAGNIRALDEISKSPDKTYLRSIRDRRSREDLLRPSVFGPASVTGEAADSVCQLGPITATDKVEKVQETT